MLRMQRRTLIGGALLAPAWRARASEEDTPQLLRAGGVVLALRHALAPGTFDPPDFRLGDCSTQRNLSEEGRAQARRIGQWFRERSLAPAAVRSSPWCRCLDTAELAFAPAQPVQRWAALGSPRGADDETNRRALRELGLALAGMVLQRGRFEVWVTHDFVLQAFAGQSARQGEGLVLRAAPDGGRPQTLARVRLAPA